MRFGFQSHMQNTVVIAQWSYRMCLRLCKGNQWFCWAPPRYLCIGAQCCCILLQAGSRSFVQLLLTCPRWRSPFFQLYMPFYMVYKTMFAKHWWLCTTSIEKQLDQGSQKTHESLYYTWASCMLYVLTFDIYFQYYIPGLCMKGWEETALWTPCFSMIWTMHNINWRHSITRTMWIGLIEPPFNHCNQVHPFRQPAVVLPTNLKR